MRAQYRRGFILTISLLFILSTSACQTLKDREGESKREEELLNTQKSVIVNYLNQGLPNVALRELRPLVSQNPKDPDFKNLMGLTYLALQNPAMALGYFEESYKLSPRPPVALNLSSALIESKQYAQAIKILKDLKNSPYIADYPYPERIHHNIALAAERMGKTKLAEKYYQMALQENPAYYLSLMRLGQVYENTKRPELAESQFQRAHETCMRCFDPLYALVSQKVKNGKRKEAATIIETYLASKEIENADRAKARQLLQSLALSTTPKPIMGTQSPRARPQTRTN